MRDKEKNKIGISPVRITMWIHWNLWNMDYIYNKISTELECDITIFLKVQ